MKTLTGEKRSTSTKVKDENGRLTNEQSERLKIWKEHFHIVLRIEAPVGPIQSYDMERGKMTENITLEHSDRLK